MMSIVKLFRRISTGHLVLVWLSLLASVAFGQDKPKVIGEIEFFGYAGSDLQKIKAALPVQEQEDFSLEAFAQKAEFTKAAIKTVIGRAPTDVAPVCCDNAGNWIIYIGLSGSPAHYNPPPKAATRLPGNALELYDRFMKALMEGLQKGDFAEDHSTGYALSRSPLLRAAQLEMRAYAVKHEAIVRAVLKTAADDQQRIAAAELLGYAPQSKAQIAALVSANQDGNGLVRNNAVRALMVLADSNPKLAGEIPSTGFVDLLLSGTWTDLNKAGNALLVLTRNRNARLLASLRRREILDRLIEMARWRPGHAEPARVLLGRLAGIDEPRLQELIKTGKTEAIIDELNRKR
jgi:hypothetical protein